MLVDESYELVVQVNGKVRGKVSVPIDATQDAAVAAAMTDAGIAKFVVGDMKKVIFVPKRLLNIVCG
jgi:leucyl-tRNA synthetase